MSAERIYIYKRYERFWHWSQALLIIAMMVTGFEVHGSYHLLGFGQAVHWHSLAAWTLLVIWAFTIFWQFTAASCGSSSRSCTMPLRRPRSNCSRVRLGPTDQAWLPQSANSPISPPIENANGRSVTRTGHFSLRSPPAVQAEQPTDVACISPHLGQSPLGSLLNIRQQCAD